MPEFKEILVALGGGPLALGVIALAWLYWDERKERKQAQRDNIETMKTIIPLASALVEFQKFIERDR